MDAGMVHPIPLKSIPLPLNTICGLLIELELFTIHHNLNIISVEVVTFNWYLRTD